MARSWAAYILPVVVIGGGIALYVRTELRPPSSAAAPSVAAPSAASPPESLPPVALLEGLAPGDAVAGWAVHKAFISRSRDDKPQLAVELTKGSTGMTIWVAHKADVKDAPVTTERYALTYGDARPLGAVIEKSAYDEAMVAIATRIRRSEQAAHPPPGL